MKLNITPTSTGTGGGITSWALYTPTLTNMGTGATSTLYWRQVGENVEIRGFITIGTSPPASVGQIGLPNSYTTEATTWSTTNQACGVWVFGNSHAVHGGPILAKNSVNYLVFSNAGVFDTSVVQSTSEVNTNTNFGAGELMYIYNVSVRVNELTP